MKTIWKFPLPAMGTVYLSMPKGAVILTIQTQRGAPQMWALVNSMEPAETRLFAVYGTGHTMRDRPGTYVGTFQIDDGNLVFHVFEETSV